MESKFTITSFNEKKRIGEKISVLTAYDYPTAKALDGEVDVLLVGDSVGMVKMGYKDTLQVTLEDMICYCKSVKRGAESSFLVVDMPYLSYHISEEETVRNAGELIRQGGANGVKLEGGAEIVSNIEKLIKAKIPVMGHIGLTPQSVNMMGGFKVQGKSYSAVDKLLRDAVLLEESGVFSIVLECVPEDIAKIITDKLHIPTIGIGAGRYCDGQVLVIDDILGMTNDKSPRFIKRYANLALDIKRVAKEYNQEVKSGIFPEEKHTFKIDENELEKIERLY